MPPPREFSTIKSLLEKKPLALNTLSRMLAMTITYPFFAINANSAAKGLAKPTPAALSTQGLLPAVIVAGTDILTILLGAKSVNNGSAFLKRLTQSQHTPPEGATTGFSSVRQLGAHLGKNVLSITPGTMATTALANFLAANPNLLQGFSHSFKNNLGTFVALNIVSNKKPGDNKARLLTALLCATIAGIHNGIATARQLKGASVGAYAAGNALAMFALQMVFEAIRYPIYADQYRKGVGTPNTDNSTFA